MVVWPACHACVYLYRHRPTCETKRYADGVRRIGMLTALAGVMVECLNKWMTMNGWSPNGHPWRRVGVWRVADATVTRVTGVLCSTAHPVHNVEVRFGCVDFLPFMSLPSFHVYFYLLALSADFVQFNSFALKWGHFFYVRSIIFRHYFSFQFMHSDNVAVAWFDRLFGWWNRNWLSFSSFYYDFRELITTSIVAMTMSKGSYTPSNDQVGLDTRFSGWHVEAGDRCRKLLSSVLSQLLFLYFLGRFRTFVTNERKTLLSSSSRVGSSDVLKVPLFNTVLWSV